MPTAVSLFSGIGGFDLGLEQTGFHVVAQVEIDPFCQRVLAARWPGVPRSGDVRAVAVAHEAGEQLPERVDLLTGGFPCQDLSIAGKRAGLGGPRSSLFHEYVRIAHALQPTWGVVENVPGLLSSHRGRDFWTVLQGLRQCWPVVGWRILDSQHFGVPQRRRRVFLVGGPTEAGVAQVLALFDGGDGHPPASGETGTDVAYSLSTGTASRLDREDTYVTAGTFQNTGQGWWNESGTAQAIRTGEHGGGAMEANLVTHSLMGDQGFDASEDGTGRGTPIVYGVSENQRAELQLTDYSRQITSGGGKAGQGYPAAMIDSAIRRLTPVECERLQGFPDGWSCLCLPLDAYRDDPDRAARHCRCPNSPRYRALGNAVSVPVIAWLGARLAAALASR